MTLRLPATSANLGPGFDAAACALDLWLEIEAHAATRFASRTTGRDRGLCGALDGNLLLDTYREVLGEAGAALVPLALRIRNEIPLGKGLGSSAAARLAGILLAVRFGRLRWSEERILAEAARREGHPDNVAACWHGGFVAGPLPAIAVAAPRWPLLLAVPRAPLPTEVARTLLPDKYERADTVANVQNAMVLTAAFLLDRRELLAAGMRDRVHELYRAPHCQSLGVLKPLAGTPLVAGVCLSGAGPAVLVVPARGASMSAVRRQVVATLRAAGLRDEMIATRLSARGARRTWRPRR